jgi:hypothetical protein
LARQATFVHQLPRFLSRIIHNSAMQRLFILLFLLMANGLFAQKILRLETPKNARKLTYYLGNYIVFRLDDDAATNKNWFEERIVDLDLERQLIIFETWQVPISDVMYVRQGDVHQGIKTGARIIQTFGASALLFGLGGKLAPRCDNCNEAIVVGVVCLGVGSAIDWLVSGRRIFKIGKKNKLRLLDLTPNLEVKPV